MTALSKGSGGFSVGAGSPQCEWGVLNWRAEQMTMTPDIF